MNEILDKLLAVLPSQQGINDETFQLVISELEQGSDLSDALASIANFSVEAQINFYSTVLDLKQFTDADLKGALIDSEVSLKFCQNFSVLALISDDDLIKVVTARPYDLYPQKAIAMATGKQLCLYLATPQLISRFLEKASADDASVAELSEQLEHDKVYSDDDDIEHLKDLASEAPIVRLVNVIVSQAMELRASDIHIEPFEQQLRVRYRIDGVLREVESPPTHSVDALISRIKIMAKLNIAERRLPQDGRIQMRLQAQKIELRVSTIPSLYGESVVMRILDQEQLVLSYEQLGFGHDNTKQFQSLIHRPHGIVLVTGPTGSGKTTTLYTALSGLNSPDKKIMTVEDPIEYQLEGIMQMQVKSSIGLGFADALRAIVRQDPDIIMIGEMRDRETASIAIQSALTGHLVFSTLHTNNAGSAVTRLLDMGVDDYLITSTIAGIVAQRLVRTLCHDCKTTMTPSVELIAEFELDKYGEDEPMLYEPVGCINCNDSGYKGRTVILEQLTMSEAQRNHILTRADASIIQAQAIREGMNTMRRDGINKAIQGITSLEEVINATQDT
jgi:general secretion pathway protein E